MGTDPDGLDFVRLLVPDPGVDDVGGEHVAAQQEFVVGFQGFERGFQRARGGGYGLQLLGLEVVDVFVERLAGPQSCSGSRPERPSAWPRRASRDWRRYRARDTRSGGFSGLGLLTGMRMMAARLRRLYEILVGASKPGTSRL